MDDHDSSLSAPSRDDPSRSDLVRIRLPSGGHEWVTPEAFNLISEKEFLDSAELRRLRRQRNTALAAAGLTVLAVLAAALAWWLRGRESARAAAGEVRPAGVEAAPATDLEPETVAGPPQEAPPAAGSSKAAAPPADLVEVEETVRSWARAWSSQDVDGYLAFYSADFRVPDGSSRSDWERLRRQRIESPRRIAVTVSDVEATLVGDGAAVARFGQAYRAPGYRDWVLKTLELRREADGWRIVGERSAMIEVAGAR